ncbi:MAG TPA: hypothetical protein VLW85_03675 [Myxococcales bacterium]|nr:hypothetical protein [Myxococcales bacterium]
MNIQRVVIGGLVAGVLCYLGDGVVHGVLLAPRWQEIAATLHLKGDGGMLYFILYDLLKGFASVLIYALVRPRLGPGPATALVAGLLVWALAIPVPLAGLLPIHFFGRKFALLWSIYGLFPVVIGALVGGAIYREEAAAA